VPDGHNGLNLFLSGASKPHSLLKDCQCVFASSNKNLTRFGELDSLLIPLEDDKS
jgi:hypothetical protein